MADEKPVTEENNAEGSAPVTVTEDIQVDGLTPLAGYALSAHEMFTALMAAGFNEEWSMAILLEKLPDWEFPIPTWDCEEECDCDGECDCEYDDEDKDE